MSISRFCFASISLLCLSSNAMAAKYHGKFKSYPNISGQVLFELKADRLDSNEAQAGASPNNAYINIEPDFSFNINSNWSVKTGWRIYPTNTVQTRNPVYPERTRTFFNDDRGFKPQDTTMIVEELKVDYKQEDMHIFAGKFNPSFGKAYQKRNRIGVFSTDITEDYELREKIGGGVEAILGRSRIALNSFFNDTTGLSGSINGRDKESRNNGQAGNTGTFSSYTITMDGDNFLGYRDWAYNIGYRSLGVDDASVANRDREEGYVVSTQYKIKAGYRTSIIPFVELVKINNFTGAKNRDATYSTVAVTAKYGKWKGSIAHMTRRIDQFVDIPQARDRQLQASAGYAFPNGITLDVSRSTMKEGTRSGVLYGAMATYLYEF